MKTWIFQGNPDKFDIDEYLRRTRKIYWSVKHKKHQNEMSRGDLVYLWRSKGSNNATSGIIASGQLVEECKPRDQVNDPIDLYDSLWQDDNVEASEIKAGILVSEMRLTPEDGMLKSQDLQKDPDLSRMQILTAHVGTNFSLNQKQSDRINEYWAANTQNLEDIEDKFFSTAEGRTTLRMHKVRERNPRLRNIAIKRFVQVHGKLFCEICNFSFAETYGELGQGFIEVHHIKPISAYNDNDVTRIKDLKIVCSNCHRMIHRGDPEQTFYALKKLFLDK
jgi:predicted HNH restriction endonuclease